MPIIEQIKPTIHILCAPGASEEAVRQLLLGMEEEGIPWEKAEQTGKNAVSLAWEAAKASRLEVGLGLDDQSLVLHFAKLEEDAPLFQISARSKLNLVRALGSNAARLVKKQPLKPLNGR